MIYPLFFLAGFVLARPAGQLLFLGAIASVLNVVVFLILGLYELKSVTGKIGADPILYPLGGLVFISAVLSTTLKLTSNKGLEWKGQAYRIAEHKTPPETTAKLKAD